MTKNSVATLKKSLILKDHISNPCLVLKYLSFLFFFNFRKKCSFNLNLFAQESYFLTLRHDKVNLRQGPSFEYPIKIFYKKKYLPVMVQDKSDNFRKIMDHENNSGWIHVSQLSKKKAALTINDVVIYNLLHVLFLCCFN